MHYLPDNNVYVYFRYNDTESVMVVVNNSKDKQTLKLDRFQESLGSYSSGNDVISGSNFELKSELSIDGKSSLILELKK